MGLNQKIFFYLPLGDSYTIGEGAELQESFPNMLSQRFLSQGITLEVLANPARTGWTTQDLIQHELPLFESMNPTVSTLLIGVNDWVQGFSPSVFRDNLQQIVQRMLKKLPEPRLLLLTIPDFSVTPEGPKYSRGRNIAEGLQEFNQIIHQTALSLSLPCLDLFGPSQDMKTDSSLVSKDQLHPSAKTYSRWADLMEPVFRDRLLR